MLTVLIVILAQANVVSSAFNCVGTCYSGRLFPLPEDIAYGKHLKGYSYRNITTDDAKKCYSSCVNDCRCKACQMKGARCELLDEDHTSKANKFVTASGYVYYDLRQEFYKGLKSHMVQPGVCHNGCCKFQTCMNGGTCIEYCDTPKEKFACWCTGLYAGIVCERKAASCVDYLRKAHGATPTNGKYIIYRRNNGLPIEVFCDFKSPKQAWTLVESFKFANNNAYRTNGFDDEYVRNTNFVTLPNWGDYRLSQSNMKYLSTKSTMFRATCDFPKRSNKLTPDYLFGYLSDFDFINCGDVGAECFKFAQFNVRGHNYFNVTLAVWQRAQAHHLHITASSTECGFAGVPDSVSGEKCFGWYTTTNRLSYCTKSEHSTTQWWLGGEI